MLKSRTENALQCRMYLGQKAADTVAGLRCLCGKIIIEAAEHGEFGDLLVSQFQRA
ncbi:hypothetical protein DP20_1237 [Shigella flexneri]|nr:hypothetical protein DP20_1237 [Shigella flexneri]